MRGCSFVSVLTLVALSVDRMIAVTWPLQAGQWLTTRRAVITELLLVAIGLGRMMPTFWARGEQTIIGRGGVPTTINCG